MFTLCACGNKSEEATIVGEWTAKLDMWEITEKMQGSYIGEMDQDLFNAMKKLYAGISAKLTFTFDENGEGSMTLGMADTMEGLIKNAKKNPSILEDYMRAMPASSDMTEEDFKAYNGMSVAEYVEDLISSNQLSEVLGEAEDTEATLDYTLNGNKLTLTVDGEDEIFTIKLDGDKMIFEDYEGSAGLSDDINAVLFEGLTFKRK